MLYFVLFVSIVVIWSIIKIDENGIKKREMHNKQFPLHWTKVSKKGNDYELLEWSGWSWDTDSDFKYRWFSTGYVFNNKEDAENKSKEINDAILQHLKEEIC